MTTRATTRWLGAAVILLTALSASAWRWRTAPTVPEVDLSAAPPAVVAAVAAAQRAVHDAPRSAAAWGKLGMVLDANDFAGPANHCFIQAERFDPTAPIWPYLQAVHVLVDDRGTGIKLLQRAVACAESQPSGASIADLGSVYLTLAEVYLEEDRRPEAAALCEQVLQTAADHPRAHLLLGLMALAEDAPERGIDHLTRASPSPFAARRAALGLAVAYRRLDDATSAAAFQRRAQELPPERPWPDAYVLLMKNHKAGARRHADRAEQLTLQGPPGAHLVALRDLAAESGDGLSHYRLGVALAEVGDYRAAEPVLEGAVRKAPQLFCARFALGVVVLRQAEQAVAKDAAAPAAPDRFRAAAALLRSAVAQRPMHGLAHLSLGQALQGLGQSAEALAEFRRAVICQPELADAHLALGEALATAGQSSAALRELEQARSLAPRDPRSAAALARVRAGAKAATPPPK